MTEQYYDPRETRDPEAREAALMAALPEHLTHARAKAPAYAALLDGVETAAVADRAALASLPVTRKSELAERQGAAPPFGGFAAIGLDAMARVFESPGPIYEFMGARANVWRLARALHAAGIRPGELIHNSFAYHLTPGGWMMDDGARTLGCPVVPAGIGNSEQQVAAIAHLRPRAFCGTPDFLKVLLDKAAEFGKDASSIAKALVSGGALFPSLRLEYAERGVAVLQCYATADLGLIAYESSPESGMILDEDVIVEIVWPGTGDPVPDGEVGEVVVTLLNPDYPLVRFATGDLSAVLPGQSACGRTNTRLEGWKGRADQTTKIKGMFVHPSQVAEVIKRHPPILKARLEVGRADERDVMTLRCEVAGGDSALAGQIADSLREICKLSGQVVLEAPESLPNDGKAIDDLRQYD